MSFYQSKFVSRRFLCETFPSERMLLTFEALVVLDDRVGKCGKTQNGILNY